MNLDEVTAAWRAQDLSPLYGVDKALLHQVLRQEQATLDRRLRRTRWFMYAVTAVLFLMASVFLAVMIDPRDDDVLSAWDYVVGVAGVASAVFMAGALLAMRRFRQAREQAFGDSLRDHLRRRIAQLDAEATGERRLAMITVAATLICGTAISMAGRRINDVPWGNFNWSPFRVLAIFGVCYLLLYRWAPRAQRRLAPRKRQLEIMLEELDAQ